VAAVCIFRVALLTWVGSLLVEDDGPRKAQAIVVLGGDDYGMRVLKAAQLAQAGYAPFAIIDGNPMLLGNSADMTIAYAEQKGYPGSLFHPLRLPPSVNSTVSEAIYLGQYLREHGIHQILLVTSNYHTHRAAYLMRREDPKIETTVVAAPDPYFSPDTWWKTREGERTFLLEWTKTLAAWLRI